LASKFTKVVFICENDLKGLVHPKMKILSVFTHPHVVPNLYVFNQTDLIPH